MKKITAGVILGVLFFVFLFSLVILRQRPMQHTSTPAKSSSIQVIGWIPNWDQENAMQSYTNHVSQFQYVSVFWYRIDASGNLTTYQATEEDTSLISFAHVHHEKIFALIANLPDYSEQTSWDAARVQKVISSESARRKHIAAIVQLVLSKNFDGADIDYEALTESQRQDFTTFIRELASALHKENKALGVAVYPPPRNVGGQDYGAQAQDLPSLANAADQLYFMTYLEHTLSSSPGPTGGLGWVANSISYAIDTLHIPKEKIFMGIGLMGTAWRQDPNGTVVGDRDDLTFQEVLSLAQNNHVSPIWDASSQSPYLIFNDMNGKHIVWFENSQSVAAKIALAKNFGLGGIAFWRLGGEDQAIWQLL